MKKKLIISEQRLDVLGFCSKTFEEFRRLAITDLLNWDQIVFAFSSMTKKKANFISIAAGLKKVQVVVLCNNIDECMEHFKRIPNMNNSKNKIEFVPEILGDNGEVLISPN